MDGLFRKHTKGVDAEQWGRVRSAVRSGGEIGRRGSECSQSYYDYVFQTAVAWLPNPGEERGFGEELQWAVHTEWHRLITFICQEE